MFVSEKIIRHGFEHFKSQQRIIASIKWEIIVAEILCYCLQMPLTHAPAPCTSETEESQKDTKITGLMPRLYRPVAECFNIRMAFYSKRHSSSTPGQKYKS